MQKLLRLFFFNIILAMPLVACAATGTSIEKITAMEKAPAGVVIEIVTGDSKALEWALPLARKYIQRLRERFPGLSIAIVSHGREQFALQNTKSKSQKKVHSLTQSLKKDDVPLHVCGTHAGWKGLTEEDFPGYVDVAPTGPAQINDYLALDYKLVVIDSRSKK